MKSSHYSLLNSMLILGLNMGHDSGACLVNESGILAAINEERLTRVKLQSGIPHKAIQEVLSIAKATASDLSAIAIEGRTMTPQPDAGFGPEECKSSKRLAVQWGLDQFLLGSDLGLRVVQAAFLPKSLRDRNDLKQLFHSMGFRGEETFFDHHHCHAASAYYTQEESEGLALTLDASGEGYCSRIYRCHNNQMELLHSIPCYYSPAYYYASITLLLGFTPLRHEGKVTGLAAHGKPDKVRDILKSYIRFNAKRLSFENPGGYYLNSLPNLKRDLTGFSREDIAAGIQDYTEELVTQYIQEAIAHYCPQKTSALFLAGGLFANVKVNQRIRELKCVKSLYVFPNMGDGGLNLGAALIQGFKKGGFQKRLNFTNLYFGRPYGDNEIQSALSTSGLSYSKSAHISLDVANKIIDRKVVGRFQGAMEYGPRALGNRSIVYSATDPEVNQWLNQRLNRTEFMPFAPVVRDVDADEYFILPTHEKRNFLFMTETCAVTQKCRDEAMGIVHVDGTARPQIISRKDNESYYDILSHYRNQTGIGVLVNTSFNIHEEPIINTPGEALETFRKGKLDVLAIGDYLVENA